MAPEQQVKRYLAYWFQLGKRVLIQNGGAALKPRSIMAGDRYSDEFESIWQQIISPDSGDCYLEGTEQTIAELLTPVWDLSPCARCQMPVPVRNAGMPAELCPCSDLPTWPNLDLPLPREPINSHERLSAISDRLNKANRNRESQENLSSNPNAESHTHSNTTNGHGRLSEIRDRLNQAHHH